MDVRLWSTRANGQPLVGVGPSERADSNVFRCASQPGQLAFCLEISGSRWDHHIVKDGATRQYVDVRENGYWIAQTRISLDSVVRAFLSGFAPETIVTDCFPLLKLEQVYGAITWYLAHRPEFDSYLRKADAEFEDLRRAMNERSPELTARLKHARKQLLASEP